MKSTTLIKRGMIAAVIAACGITVVFAENGPATAPVAPLATPPATATAAPTAVATVNGKDVDAKLFDDLLMRVAGLRVFEEVLDLVLVQQACANQMIPIGGPDFEPLMKAEIARTLADLGPDIPEEKRPELLRQLLQRQGITEAEFQMGMQRSAGLRRLSKGQVAAPTPQEIKERYDALYGERVKMEVVTIKTIATDAKAIRARLDGGEKLKDIAASMGFAWQEVTLPKNNTDPEPVKLFRDIAFNQGLEKGKLSGTISAKVQGNEVNYVILITDRPPANATLQNAVQSKLEEDIAKIKEANWMSQELTQLRANSNVDIKDPILKEQFQRIDAEIKRMKAAAATQPGTTLPAATAPAATMPLK